MPSSKPSPERKSKPVALGVIGVGHLGNHHARILAGLPECRLVGLYDNDPKRAAEIAEKYGIAVFEDRAELIAACEAISLVTPTSTHAELGMEVLRAGRHLFLEKPITVRSSEGRKLVREAKKRDLVLQVGHVERFNPAFEAILPYLKKPRFIEVHRLNPFHQRGTDVAVVLDLMIHDLDLLLTLVGEEPDRVEASGVSVVTREIDLANVRLHFPGGCVANVTTSRVSLESLRKMRIFQPAGYLSCDFGKKQADVVLLDPPKGLKLPEGEPAPVEIPLGPDHRIVRFVPPVPVKDALTAELRAFCRAVRGLEPVSCPGEEGVKALALAERILRKISRESL